jgi:DNA polymerase-1
MIKIDKYIVENKLTDVVFPLLQVHDELVYEIKEDRVKELSPQIEKLMESVVDIKDTKGVVLKASANTGNNWGELK